MGNTGSPKGGEPPKAERQSVQVIARAATILRALERNPEGLSLGEIAKLVDLSRSTVQRIVDALDRERLVLASSMGRGVRLGPALLRLAAATHFEIGEMARGTMEALSRETGETVDLSVLDDDKIVFVHQVVGSHALRAVSAVSEAFPLHCTSPGKVFLASLDEVKLARLKKRIKLTRFTPATIVSWSALEKELETVRRTGIGADREEYTPGISAVAVLLEGPTGDLAALSVPVPTQRFESNEREIT
ncbi:IclR family transcriptional regulator, partial [bacterium]|nr:IclR family transcriptional regulator [bacterium]